MFDYRRVKWITNKSVIKLQIPIRKYTLSPLSYNSREKDTSLRYHISYNSLQIPIAMSLHRLRHCCHLRWRRWLRGRHRGARRGRRGGTFGVGGTGWGWKILRFYGDFIEIWLGFYGDLWDGGMGMENDGDDLMMNYLVNSDILELEGEEWGDLTGMCENNPKPQGKRLAKQQS